MEFHPVYGMVAIDKGWVPAPGYLLRRDRVLKLAEQLPKHSLLEIGCGTGALLHDLRKLGFLCEALETSAEAREFASSWHAREKPAAPIHSESSPDWVEKFDLILALEVLEHIEDDAAALSLWTGWLKPGGTLLLSVPAHRKKWRTDDEEAGHFRRYEKAELLALLARQDLQVERFECWGFPLSMILRPLKIRIARRNHRLRLKEKPDERKAATERSGVERSSEARAFPLLANPAGVALMKVFIGLQKFFLHTELGNGFLVQARKK